MAKYKKGSNHAIRQGDIDLVAGFFRILKGWKIKRVPPDPDGLSGTIAIHNKKNEAILYDWPKDESRPMDFDLHEILHCALRALTRMDKRKPKELRQAEEELVQDLCALMSLHNADGYARPGLLPAITIYTRPNDQGIVANTRVDLGLLKDTVCVGVMLASATRVIAAAIRDNNKLPKSKEEQAISSISKAYMKDIQTGGLGESESLQREDFDG